MYMSLDVNILSHTKLAVNLGLSVYYLLHMINVGSLLSIMCNTIDMFYERFTLTSQNAS
jgi:hypothetical protein